MTTNEASKRVRSVRVVPLDSETAFACFSEARHLERWFGRGAMTAMVDLRVGGRYRFAFPSDDGPGDLLCGEYLEVVPAKRLVFTWQWREGGKQASSTTTVTVEFRECGEYCEVVVIHEGFADPEQISFHNTGWSRSFSRLLAYVECCVARTSAN